MERIIEKAKVLMEALPYIRRFYDKVFVIKYGGHAMLDEGLKSEFCQDVVMMKYIGINPVVVHGGGPQIEEVMKKLGKKSVFVDGIRMTDEESMDIIEMVLVGKINKEIVALINYIGGKAVGLSGKDAKLIVAKKVFLKKDGQTIDMGRAGEVETINPKIIKTLGRSKFIPIIAPVGVGEDGETYNINADTAAGRLAASLKAEKLILLTDVEGVKGKDGRLLSSLDAQMARNSIADGTISGGMIPKVECCLRALEDGVKKVHIINGRISHSVLLEIFTQEGIGTEISLKKKEHAAAGPVQLSLEPNNDK